MKDDLIRRQDAIERLTDIRICLDDESQQFMDLLIREISDLPSAERRGSLTDLYVIDTESGRIHLVGSKQHDSLSVFDGEVHYFNLHNGDGGTAKDGGFVILQTEDGSLVGEYGIVDKRYEKEIEQYLSTNF